MADPLTDVQNAIWTVLTALIEGRAPRLGHGFISYD